MTDEEYAYHKGIYEYHMAIRAMSEQALADYGRGQDRETVLGRLQVDLEICDAGEARGLKEVYTPPNDENFLIWRAVTHVRLGEPSTQDGSIAVIKQLKKELRERYGDHPSIELWCARIVARTVLLDMGEAVHGPARDRRATVEALAHWYLKPETKAALLGMRRDAGAERSAGSVH